MKRGSTIILKSVIGILGLLILIFAFLTFTMLLRNQVGLYSPILLGVYVSLIPFFYALFQAYKLLNYIDHNKAFSTSSVSALKAIKYSATIVGIIYAAGLPFIYYVADKDDSPGSIVMGMIIAGGAFVAAAFVAVAQRLFQNAVDIKSENDLTV